MFVHHNSVAGDGFKPLAEGAKVDFDDVGFQRGGPRAGAPVASPGIASAKTQTDRATFLLRCGGHETAAAADLNGLSARPAWEAEGEGFEPSIRLTTDNGFRDRPETADLQVF